MQAGVAAAQYIKSGMTVGLGTGSTVFYMVEEVGRRVKEEGLSIECVVTSEKTRRQAEQLNIPLKNLDEVGQIDLTIDGADEISADYQGIKGGGAALLFEKIVATYSRKNLWIVDDSKMVEYLGAFPLPVEVVPFGCGQLFNKFNEKGYAPAFRKQASGDFLKTDGGHYIIDLHLEEIKDPQTLAKELSATPGVVEHGLFIDVVNAVIIGSSDGVKTVSEIR